MRTEQDVFDEEIAPLLKQLKMSETPDSDLWWEIWDTLHHQGDVYISSYIAVPKIFEIYTEKN